MELGRLLLVGRALGAPEGLPTTTLGRMIPSFMARKRGSSSTGRPEQVEEDPGREEGGELGGEVDLAPVDEPVDELVDRRGHRLLDEGHLAGGEDRVEELAVLLVVGRVDLQGDQGPDVLQVHGVGVGREDLGMAEDLVDLDLAGERHAHVPRPA